MIYRLGLIVGCLAALAIVGGAAGVALHRSRPKMPTKQTVQRTPSRYQTGGYTLLHSCRITIAGQEYTNSTYRGARQPDGTIEYIVGSLEPVDSTPLPDSYHEYGPVVIEDHTPSAKARKRLIFTKAPIP